MKKYDVFISYAVEDKHPVASCIASGLKRKGLNVYFVSDELLAGKSVSETVYHGLETSRYCVLILSRNYVRKWPIIERSHILRRERKTGRSLVFPVWSNITYEEVTQFFPDLADRYAISGTDLEQVVDNLYTVIRRRRKMDVLFSLKRWGLVFAGFFLFAALLFRIISGAEKRLPPEQVVTSLIQERISNYQVDITSGLSKNLPPGRAGTISLDSVKVLYDQCSLIGQYTRNDYSFSNGWESATGHSNIEGLGIVLQESPHNGCGIPSPEIWLLSLWENDSAFHLDLAFADTSAPGYGIDSMFWSNDEVHIWVKYTHNIRMVYYSLNCSGVDQKRKQRMRISGFKPREEYIVDDSGGRWEIRDIK